MKKEAHGRSGLRLSLCSRISQCLCHCAPGFLSVCATLLPDFSVSLPLCARADPFPLLSALFALNPPQCTSPTPPQPFPRSPPVYAHVCLTACLNVYFLPACLPYHCLPTSLASSHFHLVPSPFPFLAALPFFPSCLSLPSSLPLSPFPLPSPTLPPSHPPFQPRSIHPYPLSFLPPTFPRTRITCSPPAGWRTHTSRPGTRRCGD